MKKQTKEKKITTDMFGFDLRVGDIVNVFKEGAPGWTDTKTTRTMIGTIKDIDVFPTGLAVVIVNHYKYTEDERNEPENKHWKEERETDSYWNKSILGQTMLRETRPELFL